jgi:site-specific DNA recombinase
MVVKAITPQDFGRINCAYVRVSTEGQAEDGMGAEVQMKAVAAFAAGLGIEIHQWFSDVGSGATDERRGLQRILELVNLQQVDKLLVYKCDRLARDVAIMETAVRTLRKNGCELISATEHMPKGPVGDLLRQVLGAIAAYERQLIRARTMAGKALKVAKEGTYAGGGGLYGYRPSGGGQLEVVSEEAKVVAAIFALRKKKGWSLARIADALNSEGLKPMKGEKWYAKQVQRVLGREEVYKGKATVTRSESGVCAHEPII